MKFEYLPNQGFRINSELFSWGESRSSCRAKLKAQHEEEDRTLFEDKSSKEQILQKRDIYEDLEGGFNFFFLNYNSNEELHELELNWGVQLQVKEVQLNFEDNLQECKKQLSALDADSVELEKGSILFKNLLLNICNDKAMGGDGNGLSYVYAAANIDHLLEE